MEGRGRRVVAVMVACVLTCVMAGGVLLGLAACGTAVRFGTTCLPAPLQTSPSEVAPGGTITVSSPAADCDLGYGDRHTYTLALASRGVTSPPVTAEVARDGTFSAELIVPAGFALGSAFVIVTGSPFDECGKDGTGSCAGYGAEVLIR